MAHSANLHRAVPCRLPVKMPNYPIEANPPDQGDRLPSEAVQKRPVAQTYPSGYEPAMLEPAAGGLRYDL
ncbi:hypothetical protein MRX96_010248 [Rhipicephalus microplus]